jgi:type I restriction-modification system DNA methylase subunit
MDRQTAIKIISDTFEKAFDKGQFFNFSKNLVNFLDTSKPFTYQGNMIPDAYERSIRSLERIGKYEDAEDNKIDVLIVRLKKEYSLERARTMQRNFVAWYLNGSRGHELKDAALVAFVSPDERDWRFSLVRMDYNIVESPNGKIKVETELTPARRYSFLVGENESSHTAQVQLLPILENDKTNPLLSNVEKAFSIEVVTREFFNKYRELFHNVEEALENIVKKDGKVKADFAAKGVDTVNFAKKLLGQVVFLYFLQKKGWFGVGRDEDWRTGPKNFLRLLFEKKIAPYQNFFNDILEPLFYEALAVERTDDFYSRFNCKVPFLNGGLFDPINNYDWVHTDILLPNKLFSNTDRTNEGDVGTGILDVFDRYNFTVKEDEPLDKEVAVDPEMLGKVFENLLEVKDRKSKGTYYTPREIVHYMCQESLINYLDTAVNTGEVPLVATKPPQGKLFGKLDPEQRALKAPGYRAIIPREDIEALIRMGELAVEHDSRVEAYGKETERYSYKLPESIRWNAKLIDEKLANIRVCDPAIGSGAFPVGLMTEIVRARNTITTYLPDKEGRTNYNFKRHAIQNCLYGVDIDPGAVEIAKLRLWLSLVVDEEDIKQIQPLPNLDYKIVCGNSLLGVEKNLFNVDLFNELESLKPVYFNETNVKKKREYKKQIDQLIKKITNDNEAFDFDIYFSEVFHEKGGFDVVIANPPYGAELTEEERGFLDNKFSKNKSQVKNSAIYFIYRASELLRNVGVHTYIVPKSVCYSMGWNKCANVVVQGLPKLIDTGKAFEEVKLEQVIFIRVVGDKGLSYINGLYDGYEVREFAEVGKNVFVESNVLLTGQTVEEMKLIKKIISRCNRKWADYVSIERGLNWQSQVRKKHGTVPIHRGAQLSPYFLDKATDFIDLKKFRRSEYQYQLRPKILNQLALAHVQNPYPHFYLQAVLDLENRLVFETISCTFVQDSLVNIKFLLAINNSKLFAWLLYKFVYSNAIRSTRYDEQYIGKVPCPDFGKINQKPIIQLVDQILAITKDEDYLSNPGKQTKVSELERQIDQMVYKLYGLTPAEIGVVEGSIK